MFFHFLSHILLVYGIHDVECICYKWWAQETHGDVFLGPPGEEGTENQVCHLKGRSFNVSGTEFWLYTALAFKCTSTCINTLTKTLFSLHYYDSKILKQWLFWRMCSDEHLFYKLPESCLSGC